jgi:hypothetical protein
MNVKQWDVLTYNLGRKTETGVVLQCLDCGDVRVDTDGVIEKSRFVSVEHGKGKKVIYSSWEYKEHKRYRIWLWRYFGLPIKEA